MNNEKLNTSFLTVVIFVCFEINDDFPALINLRVDNLFNVWWCN